MAKNSHLESFLEIDLWTPVFDNVTFGGSTSNRHASKTEEHFINILQLSFQFYLYECMHKEKVNEYCRKERSLQRKSVT